MDAAWRTPADKHFGMQPGVDTRISGGPANATRYKQISELDRS